jgi:hypothetical protein
MIFAVEDWMGPELSNGAFENGTERVDQFDKGNISGAAQPRGELSSFFPQREENRAVWWEYFSSGRAEDLLAGVGIQRCGVQRHVLQEE